MVFWTRRRVVGAAGLLAAGAARAEAALPRVEMDTGDGVVTVELALDRAPVTCRNFLRYVAARRFDDSSFYRAVRTPGAPETGFVQGGLQNDPRRLYPPIAHESTLQTGLKHVDGTLSMARGAPGTATADFFIIVGSNGASFDADPQRPGDNLGYAAFGQVVDGMDVVRAILASPTEGRARNPTMAGQILTRPVVISRMRRLA